MNLIKRRNLNRGFTLVELIIVIAILAIIMLIASLAYSGIQKRMKIRSDKATCEEIGKALSVREVDLDKSKGIKLFPQVVEYDTLDDIENYIKPGLTPQSMPDGGYIVTAIQTETGKKILVGIGKNGQDICTYLYKDDKDAGWVWSEGGEVGKFIDDNIDKLLVVKTITEVTGGASSIIEEGGESTSGEIDRSTVAVGSYINYTGGNYTGKWQVLRNNGGGIEIISKTHVGNFTLSGADGFARSIKLLNEKSREYINSDYAISGRCLGATSWGIQEINQAQYPITFEAARSQVSPYWDSNYSGDAMILTNYPELRQCSTWVWVASRRLVPLDDSSDFDVRITNSNGTVNSDILYRAGRDNTSTTYTCTYGIRPVITLKSGIRIVGGSGTEGDPYRISM